MSDHMREVPRPGSCRLNGGDWFPCRFTLDGTGALVDWEVDADHFALLGANEVEIVICPGVIVKGSILVGDVLARNELWGGEHWSFSGSGNGSLRSTT